MLCVNRNERCVFEGTETYIYQLWDHFMILLFDIVLQG